MFYEETNRKRELMNMEEIIPVLILVLLFTQLPALKGELQLILDFIEADPS